MNELCDDNDICYYGEKYVVHLLRVYRKESSQPTAAPNPESVSGNEVQMKEEKMSKVLTVTRQIAPKVRTTLIDEISKSIISQNHANIW